MKRIFYILAVALSFFSCTDEIDESNRYTFTGETVADYMLHRSDKYSHMITLMKRANLFGLLATYGQYTLFLPDNDGVEKFIYEQDSIYHATKNSEKPVWTGITSPYFEDLSDSMATIIARNHLVEGNYRTPSFEDGSLPCWNFNNRYLGITFETSPKGYSIKINNSAAIVGWDNEVENGVIQVVDKVVKETNNTLPEQIGEYDFFTLFNAALEATCFCDSLQLFIDKNFIPLDESIVNSSQTPQQKYYKYTGFIEPDEVFYENGIYTLKELKAFAEKWYGTEDRNNPCSPRNALYKFVAYHFVERELTYNKVIPLTVGKYSIDDYMVPGHDCYDYFETMLGPLMKVTKPLSSSDGKYVYINRPKDGRLYNFEMYNHLNVRIIEPTEFLQMNEEYSNFTPYAKNGIIQPIDKILIYNEDEMAGNILNERLRFDFTTLLPELSCNNIRHIKNFCVPYYFFKNVKNNTNTGSNGFLIHMIGSYGTMFDELRPEEYSFDVSFRLPPVPQRVYEIRINVSRIVDDDDGYGGNALVQPYIDGKACSLPIDARLSARHPDIGWKPDEYTFDNGYELDKQMRNRGWMKGPDSFITWDGNNGGDIPSRSNSSNLRKIITRTQLNNGEHWIRFKNVNITGRFNNFFFDYIELVPLNVISDPSKPEDRH
ncbi:MAG: fasciclin domain-containing protein [Bacteroidaceae bacterium]|nr:fasciclin domain-containing protein [Bacteroidaceae bacterium]